MSDTERSSSARAIHALAASRRPHSNSSLPRSATSEDGLTSSTFDPAHDDALMSTKHNFEDEDSHCLPKLRSTAVNRRYYNPELPPNVPTSAVRREFQDFDHSNSTDEEEMSLDMGRGMGHTPSKPNKSLDSDILLDIGNSVYEVTGTPPIKSRPTPKRNLQKEAALRRASNTRLPGTSSYAKTSRENNPPQTEDYGYNNKTTTRFGTRTVSADNDTFKRPMTGNSQRSNGTPRGIANSTAQSFLLPEMPNITELIGGSYKDGTPIFSRSGRAKTRIASINVGKRPDQPNFYPVGGIPIPEEEKAILASLQILKDRVFQLEQEKSESDRKVEEYELEVSDMRMQLDAQENIRRSDSALGSTDGEGPANQRTKWRIEKAQLTSSVQSMQRRVEQAERKISSSEGTTKRVTQERDSLVTQLGVAFYNSEELKGENETLKNENRLLQDQVTDLQTENRELVTEIEQLRSQVDLSHDRHDDETQRWAQKEAALNRKVNTHDRVVINENQTLRDELLKARQAEEAAERQASRREAKARREAERAAHAEHIKLAEENENLKVELEQAQANRDAELKRWAGQQAELQAHIGQREETIHHLQAAVPQEQINDDLRQENQDLKAQLARFNAETRVEEQGTPKDVLRKRLEEVTNQHVEQTGRWTHKESRLRDRLEQAKEVNDLHRELDAIRGDARPSRSTAETRTKRRSTGQIGLTVRENMTERTERDTQQTRSRSKSQSRRVRPETRRNMRHVSAPIMSNEDDEDELSESSTTDLSFDPAILAGAPRSGGRGGRPTGFIPARTGDTTYLSFIDGDEIENLRRRLEEERISARQRTTATTQANVQADDVTGYSIRRRNSQRDLTGRSRASSRARSAISRADSEDEEEEEADVGARKEDTIRSNYSRTSRASHRHRSSNAFTEMTSAFILPDITLHARKDATTHEILKSMSSSHDRKSCAVCQRLFSTSPLDAEDMDIPVAIPVSTRPEFQSDIDATMRPSQPPAIALSRVIKDLSDELHHLKLELAVLTQRLGKSDPALSKRARKDIHAKIEGLNRAAEAKSDQIYALFDVCEAHRAELEVLGEGEGLPDDVERTLERVRVERATAKVANVNGGRKVGFGGVEGVDESEVWGGISDTDGF